jgi:F-box and WD-40 domain protein CDC4
MDGTVRIWNLKTGQAVHVLQGHTSLVGLLGLSPSHLVSAAADSTLRIWDPTTGQMQHTLAAHTGAITCFQHDEFKVLSGSDGTLKMWDVRDGSVVRDLLTNITGVWQVVFDGRWCVAASNRLDQTHLDVWDFGGDDDDQDWVGESSSLSDEDEEEDDIDQADNYGQGAYGGGVSDMDVVEEALDEDGLTNAQAWNSAGPSAGPSTGPSGLYDGRTTRSSAHIQIPPFNDDDNSPTRPKKSGSGRGR